MTASAKVSLARYGRKVVAETAQMRKRIKYYTLTWQIPEHKRQEVLRVCAHCTARLSLEGKPLLDSPSASAQGVAAASAAAAASATSSGGRPAKRPRSAAECLVELRDLKLLLDNGALTQASSLI